MAKSDSHDDDFSFLPTVEDSEALSKEELWKRAKEQVRKRQPAPPPRQLTKEELWAQTKGRKANIRHVEAAPAASQPEPEPELPSQVEEIPVDPEWERTMAEAYGMETEECPTERLREEAEPPQPSEEEQQHAPEPEAAPELEEQATEKTPGDDLPQPAADSPSAAAPGDPKEEAEKKEPAPEPGGEEHHVIHLLDPNPEPKHEPTFKEKMAAMWAAMGGRYLTFSILLHVGLLLIAGFIVFTTVSDPDIDFIPGGGTQQGERASQELQNTVQKKRMPWAQKVPLQRLAVNSNSALQLPDDMMDMPMPDVGNLLDSSRMGAFGFGSSGAGGGFGNGIGAGGKSGVTFKPITMFGRDLGAKRLAVILDVSTSMTPYLSDVVKEVDKVAKGSVVVCYFGCGLMRPPKNERVEERIESTGTAYFERFWRIWHGMQPFSASKSELAAIRFSPRDPIPKDDVYSMLRKRPYTYFADYNGIVYAWTALLSNQVRNADALYWFSDFMDEVDDSQVKIVLENLKNRKQKLFIQPSEQGGYFNKIRDSLVKPTGGDVILPPEKR